MKEYGSSQSPNLLFLIFCPPEEWINESELDLGFDNLRWLFCRTSFPSMFTDTSARVLPKEYVGVVCEDMQLSIFQIELQHLKRFWGGNRRGWPRGLASVS